jgi:hypothetical protein
LMTHNQILEDRTVVSASEAGQSLVTCIKPSTMDLTGQNNTSSTTVTLVTTTLMQ